MTTPRQDAMKALSTLPEDASIDDIMYRLYVIEKVHDRPPSALAQSSTFPHPRPWLG